MKPRPIVGLPDDEEDLFAFLNDPQPVSHPGNPSRAASIERAGFCQACATACADGEAVGFRNVPPVCDSCRGRMVPVNRAPRRPGDPYRSQKWAVSPRNPFPGP